MTPAERSRPADGTAPAKAADSKGFAAELRSLVEDAGADALLAGSITLIGLDRIKEKLGRRWEALAERAHRITNNTIQRHLAPGDIYTSWHDTRYVLILANLTKEQAQLKCRIIASEIGRALLGEEGAEELEVKHAVSSLSGELALLEMPSLGELMGDEVEMTTVDAAEPARPAAQKAAAAPEPLFVFRPMWDPALNVLSTYCCSPVTRPEGPNDRHPESARIEAVQQTGSLARERVVEELHAMARDGRKLLLFLPIHFDALSPAAWRRAYVEALAQSIHPEETKFLVIEIVGVPDGIPQSRLLDLATPLKRYCRSLVARVSIETSDLAAFKGTGIHAVGCDLYDINANELFLMQLMSRFQRAAERAELATYIRGINSLSLAAAALGAGFRYIEGDGIAKPVPQPQAVVSFRLFDIYRPLIQS